MWQSVLDPVNRAGPRDRFALELLRVAGNDPATVSHALAIGRGELSTAPADGNARAAVAAIETAIGFLGVRPEPNEAL